MLAFRKHGEGARNATDLLTQLAQLRRRILVVLAQAGIAMLQEGSNPRFEAAGGGIDTTAFIMN
jgi:hypothetical protein